jgi:hypothetical protein
MVFDVESIGLHGEGFAVGYVVIEEDEETDSGYYHCMPGMALGRDEGREWIEKNVRPILEEYVTVRWSIRSADTKIVRKLFWDKWEYWKAQGARLAADVPWPVEVNFLSACIADDPITRNWQGPYPLLDIASIRIGIGLDPLGTEERLPDELPIHHPLADARQSARLMREALARVNS